MLAFAIHYCGMVVVVVVVVVVVGWIIVSNTIDKFFVVPEHSFYFTFYGARGESFSEGCKCPSENALALLLSVASTVTLTPASSGFRESWSELFHGRTAASILCYRNYL